ncbi:WWE domain/WD domain G-beta repeat [Lotmaria passim]
MGAAGSSNKTPRVGGAPPRSVPAQAGASAGAKNGAASASAAAAAAAPPAPAKRGDRLRVIVRHLRPGEALSSEVGRVTEGGGRVCDDAAAAERGSRSSGTLFGWFVEDVDNPGSWEPYPKESADRLEDAFLHQRDSCTVVMKKHTYSVNLNTMQQLPSAGSATATAAAATANRAREVKRVPVVQYVDPATGCTSVKEVALYMVDPFADEEEERQEANQGIAQGAGDTMGNDTTSTAGSSSATGTAPANDGGAAAASSGLPHLIQTVVPHSLPIYTMETTPSLEQLCPEARAIVEPAGGALVLSSGKDSQLLEWSLDTSRVITKYELPDIANKNSVLTANYSATGKWMIAGLDDRTARLYAIGNQNEIHRLEGHTHKVYGAGILAGDLQAATASMDCRVKVWDVATGTCVHTITPHKSHIFVLRPHPADPNFALTAGEDRNVCMHDFRQQNSVVGIFTGHERTIWDLDWNPVDGTFASCGMDSTMRVYDPRASTMARETLRSHTKAVHSLKYTPHGRGLLSCSKDLFVNLTDTSDWSVRWQAKAHAVTVFRVRYYAGKEVMLTAASDSSVNVWKWTAVNQL